MTVPVEPERDPVRPDPVRPDPVRQVFANRTLNLRSVAAIGYDMDYTLIHYRTEEWESAAFDYARSMLARQGWPVDDLAFTPDDHLQGLVLDLDLGNLVKATRFGYVIQAHHGTRRLSFDEVRTTYAGTYVDLAEPRWQFLNTLFSLSEASMYAQLVDRLDAGEVPGVMGYDDLYRVVRTSIDESHAQGALKAGIIADPDRFVDFDEGVATTLLDQRAAGKLLLLITNSDWAYTRAMMSWCFDRQVPSGNWRDLFDLVVVAASKPRFFAEDPPAYRWSTRRVGCWLRTEGLFEVGSVYHGGSARAGRDQPRPHRQPDPLRRRPSLRRRPHVESDAAVADGADHAGVGGRAGRCGRVRRRRTPAPGLMTDKAQLEDEVAVLRLERVRRDAADPESRELQQHIDRLSGQLRRLDERIAPLAQAAAELGNAAWGPLMRAGNDKSLFARQVERHADVYTSRVSNLGLRTPFAYLRATRTSLPHDLV
jgi:5'-nucleotidase